MNDFWKSDTYQIVKTMRANGNLPGIIALWKSQVEAWALSAVNDPDAVSVRAWLPMWQVRPFYTAEELAPIWPALAIALGLRTTMQPQLSPALLEHQLKLAKLPCLHMDGRRFYVVERLHYWEGASYGEIKKELQNA